MFGQQSLSSCRTELLHKGDSAYFFFSPIVVRIYLQEENRGVLSELNRVGWAACHLEPVAGWGSQRPGRADPEKTRTWQVAPGRSASLKGCSTLPWAPFPARSSPVALPSRGQCMGTHSRPLPPRGPSQTCTEQPLAEGPLAPALGHTPGCNINQMHPCHKLAGRGGSGAAGSWNKAAVGVTERPGCLAPWESTESGSRG